MRWPDMMLTAGLITGLVGIVLTARQVKGRRYSWSRKSSLPRSAWYVESVGDLASQAVLVGALVLMQFGTIARHIEERTLPSNPWLSLAGSTAILVLFGVMLGRLLMRWQLRGLVAAIDAGSGDRDAGRQQQ